MVSSANSSHKAFMNKGQVVYVERKKEAGPNTEPCGIPYFTGRKIGFNCIYTNKLFFDLTKMKKLSAGCHWIIHKELISSKVDHDQ